MRLSPLLAAWLTPVVLVAQDTKPVGLAAGVPVGAEAVEQPTHGTAEGIRLVASFDGLGARFVGPHGRVTLRNPSADQPAFLFVADESPLHRKLGVYENRG